MSEEPKRSSPLRRLVVGLALIAGGFAWLADAAGYSVPWQILLPIALMVVGLLLTAGLSGSGDGALFALGLVLLILIMSSTADVVDQVGPSSVRETHRITRISQLQEPIQQGAGTLAIDLTNLSIRTDADFEASVGVGRLLIRLPPHLPVSIKAEVGSGYIEIFGEESRGLNIEQSFEDGDFQRARARLTLTLEANIGQIRVER